MIPKTSFLLALPLSFLFLPAPIRANPASKPSDARFRAYLEKRLSPRGLSLDCVDVFLEDSTPTYEELAVRERHDEKCPGDPSVAPIVGRYRVPLRKGPIQYYDPVEDRWRR